MKPALIHPKARAVLRSFPEEVRLEIGKAIFDLQKGSTLSMPLSRPMHSVAAGVEELRQLKSKGQACNMQFARWALSLAKLQIARLTPSRGTSPTTLCQ